MNSEFKTTVNKDSFESSSEKFIESQKVPKEDDSSSDKTQQQTSELFLNDSKGDLSHYTNQNGFGMQDNPSQGDHTAAEPSMESAKEPDLPSTTIILQTNWGSKIYVVGTAHFSLESQEDVAKVISAVQPNSIVIELCPSRRNMLTWDEEKLAMAQYLDHKTMKEAIKLYGVFQGVLKFLLLSMSWQITKEMGMAPGGEFRRAYKESLNIPGCVVYLGDRPIEITLRRAFAAMTWWQSLKFAYRVIFSKIEINKEEIEKFKNRDYLGNMLEMFGGEFPELKEVFVNERDLFLTYSLVNASLINKEKPTKNVVGVVGMGHLPGIQRNWELGNVDLDDIQRLLQVPPETRTSKVNKVLPSFNFTLSITSEREKVCFLTNTSTWLRAPEPMVNFVRSDDFDVVLRNLFLALDGSNCSSTVILSSGIYITRQIKVGIFARFFI